MTGTLDIGAIEARLDLYPDLLDYDAEAHSGPVDISIYEDKTLINAVVRTRLKRLAMRGMNATQAAEEVGWSPQTVRNVYRDPSFRQEVLGSLEGVFSEVDTIFKDTQMSMNEKMELRACEAFDLMWELMKSEDTSTNQKIKIATDFLDRSDITNKRHTTINKNAEVLTAEALARASTAAQEMDLIRAGKLSQFRKVG